jgi:hypothetical protein
VHQQPLDRRLLNEKAQTKIQGVSYMSNESKTLQDIISQAKLFSEKWNESHSLLYKHLELGMDVIANEEKMAMNMKALEQIYQEIYNHTFRQVLHKQFYYRQAFASFKKKIFDFTDETPTNIVIRDVIYFDYFIAQSLLEYQTYSECKEKVMVLKKNRLEKIKKLAKTLQDELKSRPLLNNTELQREIFIALIPVVNLEKPPVLLPARRHEKIAREMMIRNLAFSIYGSHYHKMDQYDRYYRDDLEDKKLTLNTAFIDTITAIVAMVDSAITERRVADIVAKIKPQIQCQYPHLFPTPDANLQENDTFVS